MSTLPYPIKAMSVGEVLDVAIRLMREHFGRLLKVTLMLALPFFVISNTAEYYTEEAVLEAELSEEPQRGARLNALTNKALVSILNLIGRLVVEPLTAGALVYMVSSIYLGNPVTPGTALSKAWSCWGSLVGASIIYGLITIFGLILLIVPGIYWALKYALHMQLVMIERCTASTFMDRSGALMKNNMGDLFVVSLLYFIILIAVFVGAAMIPFAPVTIVLMSLAQVAATIISAAIGVVFYYSCRCKNENFDLSILASQAASDDSQPAEDQAPEPTAAP